MTLRQWLLLGGLVLWVVLVGWWFWRGGAGDGGWDGLSIAIVALPLLLANEILNLFQAWVRKRREKRDA